MSADRIVNELLTEVVEDGSVPGVQYVVVDSRGILYEFYGGLSDIKHQTRMSPGTGMWLYSMTKTFTAAAVLRLADEGKLDLDESADKYLEVNPYGTSVTIRQLLSHTSGIPNPIPLRWIHRAGARWDSTDEEATLRRILEENADLETKPGAEYAYSNIGYWLLGKILAKASGKPYLEYMREQVFAPLGITEQELGFGDGPEPAKGYLARWSFMNFIKHFLIDSDVIGEYEDSWLHIKRHHVNGPAFGGLVGSARGVAKFLQDQLGSSSGLFGSRTRRLFFEQQKTVSGESIAMTPGWHIGDLERVTYFFKEGGGGGFHGEMRVYPRQQIATVMIVNETSSRVKDLLTEADRHFLNQQITLQYRGVGGGTK